MNFIDKTFYKIDDNYTIALPEGLDELKEIAIIDKNEQSLIRNNADGKIHNINNTKFTYNNTLCDECKKEYENENNNKQNLKSADIKNVIGSIEKRNDLMKYYIDELQKNKWIDLTKNELKI